MGSSSSLIDLASDRLYESQILNTPIRLTTRMLADSEKSNPRKRFEPPAKRRKYDNTISSFQEVDQNLSVEEYKERLQREDHRNLIKAVLEHDYGLFLEFVKWNVLPQPKLDKIEYLTIRSERTVELLNILCEQNDMETFTKFMHSLSGSFQEHLRNYIKNN